MSENWDAFKITTDGVPMVDTGTGKPLILRTFEFKIPYAQQLEIKDKGIILDRQQLFNFQWPRIRTMIWGDGLVASTDVDPRVIIGKSMYRIFILCEPKFRVMIPDRPTDLQTVFKNRQKKK